MRNKSNALKDFDYSISIAESLLRKEKRFNDPPHPRSKKIVYGLRGGASILMVAAFENYLQNAVNEYLDETTHQPLKFDSQSLPPELTLRNSREIIKGITKQIDKSNDNASTRVQLLDNALNTVLSRKLNPGYFAQICWGNPSPDKVKELFKSLGIGNVFDQIKPKFEKKWGKSITNTFIPDTLESTVKRRHLVAHEVSIGGITRHDLEESLRFIKILTVVCDSELNQLIKNILTK